jgi:hypothetical protein
VLRGWAPAGILSSYETERRPVELHNVERASQPAGARRATADALPWDLNGRLAHHWIRAPGRPVSTLDLVGDGLTLLAGPAEPRWADTGPAYRAAVPLAVHVLDTGTAAALGLEPAGAMLVRPDGREIRRWPRYDPADRPQAGYPNAGAARAVRSGPGPNTMPGA